MYGPLYELFEVDDIYAAAVEVVAGASLFHVVVDTDETASRILDILNKEKGGRVTFMPLNRLHPRETAYPEANDAIPMIKKLRFSSTFQKAFVQVFGKAVICPHLEVASMYARNHNLNAVTLDGDRADRKGALSGGFIDTKQSRLEAAKNVKKWQTRIDEEHLRLEGVKKGILKLDQEITQSRDALQSCEAKRKEVIESREPLMREWADKEKEDSDLNEAIVQKVSILS